MSKVVGFVVGAALIVAGVFTGNIGLIIQGGVMIVSNAVLLLTMPKAPARQAAEMSIALGEQPRSALFGTQVFTAGSLVDGFNYGGKYGTDWEVLIIRLADHKCGDLLEIIIDGESQAFAGDGAQPGRDNAFWCWYRSDTSTQPLPSVVTTNGPGWSSADQGVSGCDVIVAYKADTPDEGNPDWPGGRPRFGFVIEGKFCYDPRLDDTVPGGSGPHRWDDPSTWEITDNVAVCRYNWVRGIYANDQVDDPTMLLVGRGLSAVEAPPENIFAAANLCDELVDGQPRYRMAGPIYASQQHLEVEEMFAAATGGSIVTREGSVELEPGAAKSIVASFTDDDLLSGSQVSWNQGILSESSGEWINTVVARYVEPTQKWNDHAAPVVRDTNSILSDGKPRETSITLRLVVWVAQALRVAEITRRLGRIWGRASVTLGPRFCELEDGDWVEWTSDRRFAGATRTFRAEAYAINEKWHNQLTLREIDADVFGTAVFHEDYSEVNQPAPPAAPDTPDPITWTLTAELLTSSGASVPAIVFEGAVDDPDTSVVVFEYWKDDGVIDPVTNPDDPAWVAAGTFGPTVTRCEVTSVIGGEDYYGSVTYIQGGFSSDRLILGPVTAGELDVSGQVNPIVTAAIAGLAWKQPVRAKTTAALPANTYSNGTAGVGATLTGTSNGALAAQDGVTLVANDRLLVTEEATAARKGIYVVTQVGDGSNPYILTRATDADSPAELVCATVKVSEGTVHADQEWMCTTNAAITVGTTALVWEPSGGGAGLAVEDEGSEEGTDIERLNFTGNGVSVNVSGTEAEIVIPGGASGTPVLLETLTASSSATLNSTTAISSTYDTYLIEFVNVVPATDNVTLQMRMSTNGGSSYDSSALYDFAGNQTNTGTFTAAKNFGASQTAGGLINGVDTTGGSNSVNGFIKLYNPGGGLYKAVVGSVSALKNDGFFYSDTVSGRYRNTTAVNAFQFFFSSGNIASGTIRVYGIPKT